VKNIKIKIGKQDLNEKNILDQIPNNWADDIEKSVIDDGVVEIWTSIIIAFAEQLGLKTTGS